MSRLGITSAYPSCYLAVLYCEVILGQGTDEDPESSFELMRRAEPPLTPQVVRDMIQRLMREEIEDGSMVLRRDRGELILKQTEDPSFLTYLAAKLGMV